LSDMSTDVPGVLKPRLFSNKDLRNLILPLIIEQFLNVTIGIADTVMIASVGEAAVSGISLIDAINILFVQFFAAIATGGAVVVSQYIGRRDHPLASEAARQLIWSSTLLATLIMAILLSAHNSVLFTIYGAVDAQVMSNARIYFIITLASYPFLAVYNAGAALYRSQGNSRVSMNISLVMNFINILFNALLIYVLKWGSAGAGTATLLSRIVGAWIIMTFLLRKNEVLSIGNIVRIKLKWHMIKRILRIGIPSGIENTLFQIGKVLVLSLITSFGTASVAANAIMNLISSFILVPGSAIGLAMITVVGQCMGARDDSQAVFYTKRLMAIAYGMIACLGILMFITIRPVVGIFNLSREATDLSINIARSLFVTTLLFWPLSFALPQALRASGDVRFTMIVSILSMWFIRIGGSYLLSLQFGMGLIGVWWAMYLDWIVRSASFVTRFVNGKWKRKQVV